MKMFLMVFVLASNLYAQSDRQTYEKLIEETNELLNQMREDHSANLSQLRLLNIQLANRSKLLEGIRSEVKQIDYSIEQSSIILEALQHDLTQIKKEYAHMLYTSSKLQSADKLSYLFSSQSFNELWSRSTHFRQYAQMRRKQIEIIEKISSQIQDKNQSLVASRQAKFVLLQKEQTALNEFAKLQIAQRKMVSDLKFKENQLLNELEKYRKRLQETDKMLEIQVEEGLEMVSGGRTAEGDIRLLPEAGKLAASFQANKGKLGWPVRHGVISSEFGKQPHPVLENIFVENKGIDIRTQQGEVIRAVFEGKVTAVSTVPGMNYLVLVQHGDYFSVYANLEKSFVKIGQKISEGQEIGIVFTSPQGVSELQFQIWRGNQKLNPALWLKKTR